MKRFDEMGDAELAAALRSLRPEPTPAFAAELDQRAAAGFPRRSPQGARNPFARFLAWLRGGPKMRLLIPAGGVAVAAIAVATVVVVGSGSSGSSAGSAGQINGAMMPLDSSRSGGGASAGEAASGAAGTARESAPTEQAAPSAGAVEAEATAGEGSFFGAEAAPEIEASGASPLASPGAAADATRRSVERASQIVIGTKPGDVGEASSKVFETVHSYDGIVLNSATQNGSGTEAEASFELLIPSGKVGDAMAAFSRIGEVVNRHETTTDITAPTVGASERLQDSQARTEGLLAQLAEATTETEREVVEAELAAERRHAAHLKAKLADLHRRANLSHVSVRIVSGEGAVSPQGADEDESWGIGTALDDAGHLLSVAAGVTIVALAVLAPLLLLLVLAWLAGRAWTRRARERALT